MDIMDIIEILLEIVQQETGTGR